MSAMHRVCLVFCAVMLAGAASVQASGIDSTSTALPPDGVYLTPADVHAKYTGKALEIVLSAVQHQPFVGMPVERVPVNGGLDEIETFSSGVFGVVRINGGPPMPMTGQGPVSVLVHGHGPAGWQTGTFDTEMLSMSLTAGPALIRESPTLPSIGKTTITDIGGGMYHIDSFFDVFTELSIDGGASWMPDVNGPAHVTLIPEPSTVTLLAIGLAGLGAYGWRRRKMR